MSNIYDNWGKLVGAVVTREQCRKLCYCDSLSSSFSSVNSDCAASTYGRRSSFDLSSSDQLTVQAPQYGNSQSFATTSVGFLLENLKQLVVYQAKLIKGSQDELEKLNAELDKFKTILEAASTFFKKDKFFESWDSQIREAVYDIEDIIDTCITQATVGKHTEWFQKVFNINHTIYLAEAVRGIGENTVRPLMAQFEKERPKFSIADQGTDQALTVQKRRQEKTQHIVGLKKETESFVSMLSEESDKLEICSIMGMPGLGKTTFAWKIFEDETIRFQFPIRIWVNISQKLNMRKVLLDILFKFTRAKPDASVTDAELIRVVKDHLEKKKFLMVMDDIWKIDVWKELQAILPKENKWGRVLITTRHIDVGNYASMKEAHKLRFLSASESWDLFRYKVFGMLQDVPTELEDVGKEIVSDCKGLPLSIVIIGGILEEKTSRSEKNNTLAIKNEWEDVRGSVKKYLVEEGTNNLLKSIISLSYDELPYELKNCFLYLGVFPEDADIPVKKLIWLWVAEGLICETRGRTMEEAAHNYLKDLIRRNLVMVKKAKLDGEARICHIHDSIREICKREGGEQNLFQEINESEVHPEVNKIRRLCIHSHALVFFSGKPKLPKARSFLCFNESPMTLEGGDITYITDAFGLLRVYEAEEMKFKRFPSKLVQQLTHLRYLTLAIADPLFTALPEIVTDLWNLQSLMVDTHSQTLEMKGDIWKMRHLRHFKTRASIILKKKIGVEGKQLQTLSRLSPESCTDEVCQKAKKVLTLGIKGDLRTLGDSKCLRELESLNKLKLEHEVSNGTADNPLRRLPDSNSFPPNLKMLVLCGTRLDWGEMSTISALGKLEVLKLKQNAFQGHSWKATGSGFVCLLWLHIERADLRLWNASNDHFPNLRILHLNNCEKLSEIPRTLGKSLDLLSLRRVSPDAVTHAREIVKEQEDLRRVVKLEISVTDRNSS